MTVLSGFLFAVESPAGFAVFSGPDGPGGTWGCFGLAFTAFSELLYRFLRFSVVGASCWLRPTNQDLFVGAPDGCADLGSKFWSKSALKMRLDALIARRLQERSPKSVKSAKSRHR